MNKKSYINHYLTLFKVTTLLFTLSSNPVWANIKTANAVSSGRSPITRTYTFSGDTQMKVTSSQPAYIVFSKARDNPNSGHFQSSEVNAQPNSLAPFNEWIYTQSLTETGYSFAGFSCSSHPCPQMQLPLLLYPDNAYLNPTSQKDDDGGIIFALRNKPNVGISFQVGVRTNNIQEWVSVTSNSNATFLKVLRAYFNSQDKTLFDLRAKFHLLTDFSSLGNDEVINSMNVRIGEIKLDTWRSEPKSFFSTKYVVQDVGKISIFFQIPKIILKKQQRQCILNSTYRNIPVSLKSVKKREFETNTEIEGGKFKLRVNCGNTTYNTANGKWLFPLVKLTFTGENGTSNNGTNDLLRTVTGSGQAEGVSLKIKRENGTHTVKYGADSANMGNAGQFELHKQPTSVGGDQSAEETFKVYYVKDSTRGTLTEGKVNAAATFTMSYQ
ncbi:Fimbrial protein [Haemophilus influenzae]|nr:Fimbrial protein [Haemophilus influenzae]PRJ58356.1 Fimbrial protein [Haemophilus influenzae]